MKWLLHISAAVVLLAGQGTNAKDNYNFGEVPPPSRFSAPVDYSRAVLAAPAAVPPKVTTVTAPPTNFVSLAVVAPVTAPAPKAIQRIKVAPPVVAPKPVVETEAATSPAKTPPAPKPLVAAPKALVVTPGGGISGKVILADARGRFVILNFPFGQMPRQNTALDVFRNGVKVGEIKVTGPQRDDNTAADVVSGELQTGDVARLR